MSFASGVMEGYAETEPRKKLRNSAGQGNVETHEHPDEDHGASPAPEMPDHIPQVPTFTGNPHADE